VLVDTGGWLPGGGDLEEKVSRQVEAAVREADLVLFTVDASVGITDDDVVIATWLRRTGRPILVVANKADNDRREADRWEFLSLGLGDPLAVSALHGRRAGDLLDEVVARFPAGAATEPDDDEIEQAEQLWSSSDPAPPRVAIVGRPNVGKSTLFNRLVGEDRSVVHDMAGTTRDAIDTLVETPDGPIVFVDTAGMRKRGKIDDSAEYYSMVRALRGDRRRRHRAARDRLDGGRDRSGPATRRASRRVGLPDRGDAQQVGSRRRPEKRLEVQSEVRRKLNFLGDAPMLKISALSGKGVHKLRPELQEAITQYHRRVPTRDVNKVIAAAQQRNPAPGGAKVMYAMQGGTEPPTFTLFVNRELPAPYLRFLERSIREAFDFGSTPLKLRVRKRAE
jgi:GTP-binding protein